MMYVETLNTLLTPLLPGLMGVTLTEVTPDCVRATMKVRPDLCTTGGICHGGSYMAFADTLGAVGTFVNIPQGANTTTTASSTKFMAGAAVNTTLSAVCTPLHKGRTTQVWQTLIHNEAGKLCAVVTQSQMVLS